jgi:putative transposase
VRTFDQHTEPSAPTSSWAPPPSASPASWPTAASTAAGGPIRRWVQKFGPALSEEVRRHRKPVGTTGLVDETYVKIRGQWHYRYRGIDQDGQVLDCWLSRTRDLAAAEAFFRRTIDSTGCTPEHVVTDKAACYPSAIRTCAPGARPTATGFYNPVISTNRCERNHGYVKSRIRPMRGLKSFESAGRLFPTLDALQLIERDFLRVPPIGIPCTGGRSYLRARRIAALVTRLGRTL